MAQDITLDNVFGVSRGQVKSYHERPKVDGLFQEVILSDRQIIVYGSSKQGKTSLVNKYVPYEQNIVISITPKMLLEDIYKSILRDAGVKIVVGGQEKVSSKSVVGASGDLSGGLPFLITAKVNTNIAAEASNENTIITEDISVNLSLPNDIVSVLKSVGFSKIIILENFHYLSDEIQNTLAFDLRAFQELGVKFIILGVWREKNRLVQFNGDLLDRISEVAVEPWEKDDFKAVITKGENLLNIKFSADIVSRIIENAFDSIGVVQELLKIICRLQNVYVRQAALVYVDDISLVERAIKEKTLDYSTRHTKSLEEISEGRKATHKTKKGETPLYLAFYTVKAFLTVEFDLIQSGVRREKLEETIRGMHHRPEGIKASDFSSFLYGFAALQSEKGIRPPIFDYDRGSKTMRVVDSTFYFFLKNVDRQEMLNSLNSPMDR